MKILNTSLFIIVALLQVSKSVILSEDNNFEQENILAKKTKTLHLFDIDDVVSDIAARKNLKLTSTMFNKNSLVYNLKGLKDRKLVLKINKLKDRFDLHLNDDNSKSPVTFKVPNKMYYTNEIKNFLDNNIVKKTNGISRKLAVSADEIIKSLTEHDSKKTFQTNGNVCTITDKEQNKTFDMKVDISNSTKITFSTRENKTNTKIFNNPHHIYTLILGAYDKFDDSLKKELQFNYDSIVGELMKKTEFDNKTLENIKENLAAAATELQKGTLSCDIKDKKMTCKLVNGTDIVEFIVIMLGNDMFRISLINSDKLLNIEFEATEYTNYKAIILKLVKGKKIDDSFKDLISSVVAAIKNLKCNEFKSANDADFLKNKKLYLKSSECEYDESSITASIINLGDIFYIHLKLDNIVLRHEYFVNIQNPNNMKLITEYINGFFVKVEDVKKKQPEKSGIFEFSLDTLKKHISETYGDKVENKGNDFKLKGKHPVDVIKTMEKNNDICVTMIYPVLKKENNPTSEHPTICAKKMNSYDQSTEIFASIKDFFTKLAA